jgi:hypothetical protein
MARTNRSSIRRTRQNDFVDEAALDFYPELVPVDVQLSNPEPRIVLEAIICAHRWQLVSAARQHLGNARYCAEDIVQDLCLEVLDGQLPLPTDPTEALVELLREVIVRSEEARDEQEGGAY